VRQLIALLMLIQFTHGSDLESLQAAYSQFSAKQKGVLKKSYAYGKEFNLGYTLSAIAWIESSAGLYKINLGSKDCGTYQKNMPYYLKSQDILKTSFNYNRLCQRFVDDQEFAAAVAVTDLLYWKRGNTWWTTWKSYHCGYGQCHSYAKEIWLRIQVLKKVL